MTVFNLFFQNFYNLVRKAHSMDDTEKYFNPDWNMILDPANLSGEYNTSKFYYENGLKTISEGTVAVILNFSPIQSKLCLKKPKPLHMPDWGPNISILEFFLNQIKSLGEFAVREYGKNYTGSRDPILVLVQLNEIYAEEIENYLTYKKYFGYKGVVNFKTVKLIYFIFFQRKLCLC